MLYVLSHPGAVLCFAWRGHNSLVAVGQVLVANGAFPPPDMLVKLVQAGGGLPLRPPFDPAVLATVCSSARACYALVPDGDTAKASAAAKAVKVAVARAHKMLGKNSAPLHVPCGPGVYVVDVVADEEPADIVRVLPAFAELPMASRPRGCSDLTAMTAYCHVTQSTYEVAVASAGGNKRRRRE